MIESSWMVTCKSGNNQLVEIPDSMAEAPPVEFVNIGVREMEWEKMMQLNHLQRLPLKANQP
jgi:hypothetical protein